MAADAERGRELVADALRWMGRHPDEWLAVVAACRDLARRGYPVRRDNVYCDLARRGLRIGDEAAYVKAHDLWSALARYVARCCPDVPVRLSRCSVDEAYPSLEDLPPLPEGCTPPAAAR